MIVSFQQLQLKVDEDGNAGIDSTTPCPVFHEHRRAFLVLDYPTTLIGDGVGWPVGQRTIDAENGAIRQAGQLSSAALHVVAPPGPYSKSYRLETPDAHDLYREFRAANQQLWPAFFAKRDVTSAADQEAARLVFDRWDDVTENGFHDLYRAVGADWFQWLQRQKELRL